MYRRLIECCNYRPACLKEWGPKVAAVPLFASHLCWQPGRDCAAGNRVQKGTGGVHLIQAGRSHSKLSHFSFIYFNVVPRHTEKLCNKKSTWGYSFRSPNNSPPPTLAIPKITPPPPPQKAYLCILEQLAKCSGMNFQNHFFK